MKNEYEVVLSVNHRVSEIAVMFNYYYNNIYAFVLLLGVFSLTLSLRICCKFAHFLISTIAKEILICIVGMAALSEKNAHAPSEVVGRS